MARHRKTGRRRKSNLRNGEKVTVFRFSETGRPFIEGVATIVGREGAPWYRVRFEGERRDCWRLVYDGPWQNEPARLLAELEAQWVLSQTPELLTEFLPDDVRDQGGRS